MNAPDSLRVATERQIHRLEVQLALMSSGINSLKLLLTEIKWKQEQERIDALKD